jgi:hypothetical protein
MQFRYVIWQKGRHGPEPIMSWSPAGITSSERAREDARALVLGRSIPATGLEVTSDDGSIAEFWHWRRKQWKADDAQGS